MSGPTKWRKYTSTPKTFKVASSHDYGHVAHSLKAIAEKNGGVVEATFVGHVPAWQFSLAMGLLGSRSKGVVTATFENVLLDSPSGDEIVGVLAIIVIA